MRAFAERLSRAQGCKVTLAREKSGFHAYLPCPDCLETHGRRELQDPKYTINVSKYPALGDQFQDLRHDDRRSANPDILGRRAEAKDARDSRSGICMRTRQSNQPHRYSVTELLTMRPVSERHPDIMTKAELVGGKGSADREEHWERDPVTGEMCPPPPGQVMPITLLPSDHPAIEYLQGRGFDPYKLWEQFRCSFCTTEYPHGQNGVFYRRMPGDWRDTPQHRVIFYSLVNGVPLTWQARYPEKVSADGLDRFMLHPYKQPFEWSHVATRPNPQAKWMPVPPFDQADATGTLKFVPSKYRTAKYSSREMMGWDAALARAKADPAPIKWCVLCEGPLDAARVGPGGIALIG